MRKIIIGGLFLCSTTTFAIVHRPVPLPVPDGGKVVDGSPVNISLAPLQEYEDIYFIINCTLTTPAPNIQLTFNSYPFKSSIHFFTIDNKYVFGTSITIAKKGSHTFHADYIGNEDDFLRFTNINSDTFTVSNCTATVRNMPSKLDLGE